VVLTASFKKPVDADFEVYLCIPSKKLLANGYPSNNGKFVFDGDENGTIELIKGESAFIFANGVKGGKYYYAITPFTIKKEQHVVLDVKESTKEKILEAFKKNKLEGVIFDEGDTVVEEFIQVDPPASSQQQADSSNKKVEMQILKVPCQLPDSAMKTMY
jgi:hypothetical protein